MILQYKRMSLSAARASEIIAVKNLVSDYVRNDDNLVDSINTNSFFEYIENDLVSTLENRIDEAGYLDVVIDGVPSGNISGNDLNLVSVHMTLKDTVSGKKEDVYVVIFTK